MNGSTNRYRNVLAAVALCLGLVAPGLAQAAGDTNPPVLPPTDLPFGATYGEWMGRWWQWVIVTNAAPANDQSGASCHLQQPYSQVQFLAGNSGGTTTRACTVPADRALFLPIDTAVCWMPGDGDTVQELRDCARRIIDDAKEVWITVDGRNLGSLTSYRDQSPLFPFRVAAGNVFNLDPDVQYYGVADGYAVFLPPLPPGEHVIRFHAEIPSWNFIEDVTDHLTVVASPN